MKRAKIYLLSLLSLSLLIGAPAQRASGAPLGKKGKDELKRAVLKLNSITGDDPIKGQIKKLVKDKKTTEQMLKLATELAKGKDQPFNINASYILASTARQLRKYEAAEQFYRIHAKQALKLRSVKKLSNAYNDLIEVLYLNGKFKEVEQACAEFLGIPGDAELERRKVLVLRTMIRAQAKQGKVKDALKIVDKMIERDPKNWLSLELRGWVLREDGQYKKAITTYEDVLAKIDKDDRLNKEQKKLCANDIRYTLTGVYIDVDNVKKAAEYLKVLIENDKENPTYYNDLGYIWADHDMNLEESEKLIRKAIEMDRKLKKKGNPDAEIEDNSAYLDSLGWVLYKRKKYKEAVKPLEQAVQYEDGRHVEIYDHLAEVYWALGQKEKAIEAWKKGLETKDVSSRDKKRKEAVKKKLAERTKETKKDK